MGKSRFCDSSSIWSVSNRTRLKLVLKHNEPMLLHRSRTGLQTNPHFISFTLYWYTALNCQTLYRDVRIKTSEISESTRQRESIPTLERIRVEEPILLESTPHPYARVPQIFPWRANLLQSSAPTLIKLTCDLLMILKTLIMLRCVWLGFELNSAGVRLIWGWLLYTFKTTL